jgi:hypothetical protein
VIQLSEEDVGGALPGRPEDEARRLARRRALDTLAQPVDLGAMGQEGEAVQAIGDARSSVEDPRHFAGDIGIRPEDATPPAQGGPADMPAAPGRRVVLTEQDVPQVTASLSQPSSGDVRRTLSPQALTHRDAHQAADVTTPTAQPQSMTQPTSAQSMTGKSDARPTSAMDRELAANREAHARRVLAGALSNIVRLAGMGATGVPVAMGPMPDVGLGAEREGEIRRQHRLAAAEKDREGREAEQASARLEREQAASADEMAFRREQLDVMRQRGERGTPTSPLQQAQADRIREEIARHQREMQPDSPESSTARAQYLALVDTLPQGMRGRLMQAIPPERIETMSAAELRAPTARIQAFRERGTAGASGGGSSATIEALRRRATEAGVPEEAAAAMDRRQLVSEVNQRTRGGAGDEQAIEIIAGVTAGMNLSDRQQAAAATELIDYRRAMGALSTLERIHQQRGASAVVDPSVVAEIRAPMMALRGIASRMQGTGTITEGEMPAINAALPDPTSWQGQTLGTMMSSLRGWRGMILGNAEAGLRAYGVDDEGWRRARSYLETGAAQSARQRQAAPSTAAPGGAPPGGVAEPARVRMLNPRGQPVRVRADQREAALRQGYREVPGGS